LQANKALLSYFEVLL